MARLSINGQVQKSAMNKKSQRQRLGHRKESLIRKSYEISALCNVDVFLGIMNPENGQVYMFYTDYNGFWAPCILHLVNPILPRIFKARLTQTKRNHTIQFLI